MQLFYSTGSYGGWFVPCRINYGAFCGFSHGDLSPRQSKIRQTVAENASMECRVLSCGETKKHKKVNIWRFFAWRPFAFSPFLSYLCLAGRKVAMRKSAKITIVYTTWHKSATIGSGIRLLDRSSSFLKIS